LAQVSKALVPIPNSNCLSTMSTKMVSSYFCIGSAGHGNGQAKNKANSGRLDTKSDIADCKQYFGKHEATMMCYGEYEVGGNVGKSSECLQYIKKFFECCKRDEVAPVIYYTGHGDANGDWCFPEGKISWKDLLDLYSESKLTQVPSILSDCCHSGTWCWRAAEHQKKSGQKLQVIAACNHNKLATNKLFAKAVFLNDKDAQASLRAEDHDAVANPSAHASSDLGVKNFSGKRGFWGGKHLFATEGS